MSSHSPAGAPAAIAENIHEILSDPDAGPAPSCSVGIFKDRKTHFITAGYADIATRRRADADTIYYSGSIAKQFTALAVVQLVIDGKIKLEDDVRAFIPEMPRRFPAITVDMLLHHTSGLPNNAKLLPLGGYRNPGEATRSETLRTIIQYPRTAFPPGATFEYSNGGYLLLSEMVERVAEAPFADHVEARILRPLGMSRSTVLRGALPADPNIARGYVPGEGGFVLSEDIPLFGGAGAMMLTINDLAKYHQDIAVGHRLWTPLVTRLMTAPGRYADGSPMILPIPGHIFGYASGLMLSQEWVLHGGNYAGFQALFAWLPRKDLGIALLCGRGDIEAAKLASRIIAAVDPDLPAVNAPRFTLAAVGGRFVCDAMSAIYDLEPAGDDLKVTITQADGQSQVVRTFKRTGDGAYADAPLTLSFDPDRRGFCISNENVAERFRRLR